jgi:hypothetical protein
VAFALVALAGSFSTLHGTVLRLQGLDAELAARAPS